MYLYNNTRGNGLITVEFFFFLFENNRRTAISESGPIVSNAGEKTETNEQNITPRSYRKIKCTTPNRFRPRTITNVRGTRLRCTSKYRDYYYYYFFFLIIEYPSKYSPPGGIHLAHPSSPLFEVMTEVFDYKLFELIYRMIPEPLWTRSIRIDTLARKFSCRHSSIRPNNFHIS